MIEATFASCRGQDRAALIPYVTAGHPSADATLPVLRMLSAAGADVIELGVPFSDPLADGPTIQASSFASLQGGTTVERVLGDLETFRADDPTPVVLFTYLNPVLRFGVDRFLAQAAAAGANGLLLTDLPVGVDPELEDAVMSSPLDFIRLVAPTTPLDRVPAIASRGSGFLYYISRTGVTGAREELSQGLALAVREIREAIDLPVAVGFGISTPAQATMVADLADGVVVGSALVRTLSVEGIEGADRFVRALRVAVEGSR